MLCFVQLSTSFSNCDRKGFIEERNYDSGVQWLQQYQKILSMQQRDLIMKKAEIIGNFHDSYCYSKRMCEELLPHFNTSKIPIVILKPSIIGTAALEPMPGWTDSLGLL